MTEKTSAQQPTKDLRVEVEISHTHGMGGGIDTVVFGIKPYDSYGPSAEQAKVDAQYINSLIESDQRRRDLVDRIDAKDGAKTGLTPTPGLRVEIVPIPAGRDHGEIAIIQTKPSQYCSKLASSGHEWSQAGVDATHINDLLAADDRRRATDALIAVPPEARVPTPGIELYDLEGELVFVVGEKLMTYYGTQEQRAINIAYINWLIDTDEQRRAHVAKQRKGEQDLLVDLGDMTRANLDNIALDETYEEMTEDLLQTFNNIVIQGIPAIKAVFSMSQAFAIVLGFALRANMPFSVAKALITQVMNSATSAEKAIRIITKQ